jgi:hypothetical protein
MSTLDDEMLAILEQEAALKRRDDIALAVLPGLMERANDIADIGGQMTRKDVCAEAYRWADVMMASGK